MLQKLFDIKSGPSSRLSIPSFLFYLCVFPFFFIFIFISIFISKWFLLNMNYIHAVMVHFSFRSTIHWILRIHITHIRASGCINFGFRLITVANAVEKYWGIIVSRISCVSSIIVWNLWMIYDYYQWANFHLKINETNLFSLTSWEAQLPLSSQYYTHNMLFFCIFVLSFSFHQ